MNFLLTNIRGLYRVAIAGESRKSGTEMQDAALLKDAWLRIENDRIVGMGKMADLVQDESELAEVLDCTGKLVLPGFVDSHTHLVFARSREVEYVDRIRGRSYEEIARRGGGILNSARRLREMSEDQLLEGAVERAWEILYAGTTTVEIKSGYGLTTKDEIKILRVANRLRDYCPLTIKTTFLGAHAIPAEYKDKRDAYIDLVCEEMLPRVAEEKLADFIDVFCDEGFFTVAETARILEAGAKYGLRPKIHANELANSGGVQVGIAHNALSVDHLESTGPAEIAALAASQTMPTVLPGVSFFLGIDYAPARAMIDAGLPVCIATDYNPGSSPAGNLQFMMSLACNRMRLLPEEALVACTLNGAAALDLSTTCGSLEVGKRADLLITAPMESLAQLPYFFGRDQVEAVMLGGDLHVK
ncbi:MAG TPA: imidazolonepropionase [Bacteroidetes bacterium]|nr:imidazolonepropionase [Bacteroidota bacterium]